MTLEALIPAAFLAGFFGSAHCIGMCGAIVVLFEGQRAQVDRIAGWPRRGLYNLGRLGSYALLGAVAGAGGALITAAVGLRLGLLFLRVLAALLVIAIGLNLLVEWRFTDGLERMGAKLWKRLSPLARHVLPITTLPRAFGAGLLWGALPCGLVYSAVAMAGTTGGAAHGMAVMFAFWLGTVPALLVAGASAQRLLQWRSRRAFRRTAGALMILIGLFALMPLGMRTMQHSHSSPLDGARGGIAAANDMNEPLPITRTSLSAT